MMCCRTLKRSPMNCGHRSRSWWPQPARVRTPVPGWPPCVRCLPRSESFANEPGPGPEREMAAARVTRPERGRPGTRLTRVLERVAIVLASFAIAIGLIALLSGGLLAGRDNPGLSDRGASVGVKYR